MIQTLNPKSPKNTFPAQARGSGSEADQTTSLPREGPTELEDVLRKKKGFRVYRFRV